MINPSISYSGSKMDRRKLLDEYNSLKVKKDNVKKMTREEGL